MPHDLCPKLDANVYISWKLREIISQKVKNEIFVLCPELTGVEQYFRNDKNAMGNFILSPFRLTLILVRMSTLPPVYCLPPSRVTNTLPTSPQPLSGDDFKPRYVLGPRCPNMVIRPQIPRKLKILKLLVITRIVSPIHSFFFIRTLRLRFTKI